MTWVVMPCKVAGCDQSAAWQVVLVVHLLPCCFGCKLPLDACEHVIDPSWLLCDDHKQSCVVSRLMNPDRWRVLAGAFASKGLHDPDPSRAELEYLPAVSAMA